MFTVILNPASSKHSKNILITSTGTSIDWDINYKICEGIRDKLSKLCNIIFTCNGEETYISDRINIIDSVNGKKIVISISCSNASFNTVFYNENKELALIGDMIGCTLPGVTINKTDVSHRRLCSASCQVIDIIIGYPEFYTSIIDNIVDIISNAIILNTNLKKKQIEEKWYVVRKSYKNSSSQLVQTTNFDIAKKVCDSAIGYHVFDCTGTVLYNSNYGKTMIKQPKQQFYGIVKQDSLLMSYPERKEFIKVKANTKLQIIGKNGKYWKVRKDGNEYYIRLSLLSTI